jgi:hypothetical protein
MLNFFRQAGGMSFEMIRKLTALLFIVLLVELTLGGGGRFTALGPVSFRMILFVMAMAVTGVYIWKGERLPNDYKYLLIGFVVMMALGLCLGILTNAPPHLWWEDVKPLLYFFALPFFYFAIRDQRSIEVVLATIRSTALIQAFAFFIILFLIHSSIIPFLDFYDTVLESEELFFRGELTFFYKGFLFLSIGLIVVYFSAERHRKTAMVILMLAIFLTFTRGFLFALALTFSLYFIFMRSRIRAILFLLLAVGVLVFGKPAIAYTSLGIVAIKSLFSPTGLRSDQKSKLLGDREFADSGRKESIYEVGNAITLRSLLVGHGFGHGVASRPVHMEISYLEIFHKQGLLGLIFWGYIFWMLLKKYRLAKRNGVAHACCFGAVFVFFQSLTNQYINNPIGLSMILLSMVCLDRLRVVEPVIPGLREALTSNQKSDALVTRSL